MPKVSPNSFKMHLKMLSRQKSAWKYIKYPDFGNLQLSFCETDGHRQNSNELNV